LIKFALSEHNREATGSDAAFLVHLVLGEIRCLG